MGCNGNCSACSGCARELVLTEKEIAFLDLLGQYAFLPVASSMGEMSARQAGTIPFSEGSVTSLLVPMSFAPFITSLDAFSICS